MMFIKENTAPKRELRPLEHQILRTKQEYEDMFERAGLEIILSKDQHWKETFEACASTTMWVLRPAARSSGETVGSKMLR